jgi:hypothetical protein
LETLNEEGYVFEVYLGVVWTAICQRGDQEGKPFEGRVMEFQRSVISKKNERFYRYRLILGMILAAVLVLNESACRI